MSTSASTGSPSRHRTPVSTSTSMEENVNVGKGDSSEANDSDDQLASSKKPSTTLSASPLVNQSYPKNMKPNHEPAEPFANLNSDSMDDLLAKLSKQQAVLHQQGDAIKNAEDSGKYGLSQEHASTSNSVPITPANDTFGGTAPTTRPASAQTNEGINNDEVLRLKLELAQAQNKITHLNHELVQREQTRPGAHLTLPSPSLDELQPGTQTTTAARVSGLNSFNPGYQSTATRDRGHVWQSCEDARSDTSDPLSATGFGRTRNIWGGIKPSHGGLPTPELSQAQPWPMRANSQGYLDNANATYNPQDNFRPDRLTPDYDLTIRPPGPGGRRSGRLETRQGNQGLGPQAGFGNGFSSGPGHFDGSHTMPNPAQGPMVGAGMYSNYQPSAVGTPLSPLAREFTSASGEESWKTESVAADGQTYLPTTEPLNYRRLLDRNVNCNWKYIVDKIVCNNDQQASIFLQQKLKLGTPDQKYEIVEAIVAQAYSLMVNRFGNFLVQRCFEHGTPEQVIKIAEAIRGKTLSLSMDPFGCHVVQKAFDSVPEDYKALMVHELLCRIPETVIHRYACHVWQKLFELRWQASPPQIMKHVNEALCGMWHEVALGETGSLVVQNIFENCLEDDKRPCIEEVLANIDIVAHGQFGNWCIQHICEHGAPGDRSRAIDHVIRFAAEYSTDQYASKVVKKCLKIGGSEFLTRYLNRVCDDRMGRPRLPLIDIAGDQYGNYLIQWILTHSSNHDKETVAGHIRRHMVSLRGSKFGSRVGMLCTNPAITTKPGPGFSNGYGRMPTGPRYGGRGYH